MARCTLPISSNPTLASGGAASLVATAPGGSSTFEDTRRLQRAELLKRFSESQRVQASFGEGRVIECSTVPTLLALQDDAIASDMIQRASNPYSNHRALVRGLSLDATALNCILESSSSDIFEKLSPMHRETLAQCSTNPAIFPSTDYFIAPYALKPCREKGDLFLSELTRSDLSYKAFHMPGSPPRLLHVGADAPYGFLVMHKDTPIAAVSYVVAEGPSLFVAMTQRLRQHGSSTTELAEAKMHEKATKRLHLKEAMLSLCASLASTLGCSSITYQGAINNRWVHDMVSKGGADGWDAVCVPRMKFEDAQATYDTFCEAHGFTRDPKSGNFVKVLGRVRER